MITMAKRFFGNELVDGDVPADQWAMAIVKVACILIIGVVILGEVSRQHQISPQARRSTQCTNQF